jgi:(S)-ureidoglycine aminohydrolase
MMTVELEPGGTLTEGPTQRFLYVLEGELTLIEPGNSGPHTMIADGYAYLPTDYPHTLKAEAKARVAVVDKPFLPLASAHSEPLKEPRPWSLIAFDFACNTMTYAPGAGLAQVEIHYMEHGLLMLEGGGIYRLGDQWYPTQAGDFIWMAPYCPQWFGAIGKRPAKYLIYKDFNRHPLA